MRFNKYVNGALVGLTTVGVLSTLVGASLALGFDQPEADAAPPVVPVGTLGLGVRTVAPLGTTPDASTKVPVAKELKAATALVTPTKLAVAPLPKPEPKVAAKKAVTRSSGSNSSRSSASGSGWQSANVSWYGPGFYGHTMAGGGKLTTSSMVVAHRSLAFGTRIQFEYNGRSCTAVVMDRGPYVGGRTFDLGPGTAKALGFSGTGTVRYRILGR